MDPDDIERATFALSRRGYDPQEVEYFLHRVADQYRDALQAVQDAKTAAAGSSFGGVGTHIAAVLATAAQSAEDMKAAAEGEVHEMRSAAEEEAKKIRQAAVQRLHAAKSAKEDAEREVADIRARAAQEATGLVNEARDKASNIEGSAREVAHGLEESARANAEALIAQARREYEHLRAVQQQCVDRLASVEGLIFQAKQTLLGQGRLAGEAADRSVNASPDINREPGAGLGPVPSAGGSEAGGIESPASTRSRPTSVRGVHRDRGKA